MTTLADELVPDELWALVEPLLPVPRSHPGRPTPAALRRPASRHPGPGLLRRDRVHSPHLPPWRLLPARELGCGSPATCWRRLTELANAGPFDALHLIVLDRLGKQGQLDWSRASVDAMSVRTRRGETRWAQILSIVARLEASSTWSAMATGCR